jgi:REP element-mobilizing transposase RayT
MAAFAPPAARSATGRRPPHPEQRSASGCTYLLGVTTLYGRPVFNDHDAARAVCRVHHAAWHWRDARLLAWVLLPDRWQGLVTLGERDSLAGLMGRFKALTSRAVEDRHRINGWLWGRGFSDRVLAPAEDLADAARALAGAPVRAGLVARPGDYPYWNSTWPLAGEAAQD